MLILLSLFVGSAFVVITSFVFLFTVKRLLSERVWCPWYIKAIAYVWLFFGLFADVVFNLLWGTIIFRELPHELLFTSRVQRHYRNADGTWRQVKAAQWREFLNAVDPGHV